MTGQSIKAMVERIEAGIEGVDREQDMGQDFSSLLNASGERAAVACIQPSGCEIECCAKVICDSAHAPSVGAPR